MSGNMVRNMFENISIQIASIIRRRKTTVAPSGLELPTAPQLRRLKFVWRVLLIGNFSLGVYLFAMQKKKSNLEQRRSSAVGKTPSVPVEVTSQLSEGLVSTPQSKAVMMQQQPSPEVQEYDLYGRKTYTKERLF